jgi:hypothetical protein
MLAHPRPCAVGLRADGSLEAACDLFEERAHTIPRRTKAIVLELSLVRRLLRAHREWIDDVERELGE